MENLLSITSIAMLSALHLSIYNIGENVGFSSS